VVCVFSPFIIWIYAQNKILRNIRCYYNLEPSNSCIGSNNGSSNGAPWCPGTIPQNPKCVLLAYNYAHPRVYIPKLRIPNLYIPKLHIPEIRIPTIYISRLHIYTHFLHIYMPKNYHTHGICTPFMTIRYIQVVHTSGMCNPTRILRVLGMVPRHHGASVNLPCNKILYYGIEGVG
jgi:hypothetical protein